MTTNRQEQIEWLDTRVMNWEKKPHTRGPGFKDIYIEVGVKWVEAKDYDPFNNADQALDLLDTFKWWWAKRNLKGKHVVWIELPDGIHEARDKNLLTAICHACLRASGWEGNCE